jgi:hypothetical protein
MLLVLSGTGATAVRDIGGLIQIIIATDALFGCMAGEA